MKKIALGVMLFGSLLLAGQPVEKGAAPKQEPPAAANGSAVITDDGAASRSEGMAQARHADLRYEQEEPARGQVLRSVNGVDLSDDKQTVLRKLGAPVDTVSDPLFRGQEILIYPEMEVAFDSGSIAYIGISPNAASFELDGVSLPNRLGPLLKRLGQPDFKAEDGLVYKTEWTALKLYTDGDKLKTIHLFARSGE
ncbi:hypothetical protein J31TS4_33170 [Paenibacillus sp. J31TS4]|uniref:hypothetical protein n=1 Tax=Paenibacillus sp. J31TS4 TaxID=2807195 RepID=UPI001B0988A3|nr:hypothetical protein [Paenibacillus sp. J31TS4]GIP40037.1 hypothetical protein J31TS4_33170 [Paenibacillus sp. J31TS4]